LRFYLASDLEVCGSSPHGPTITPTHRAPLTRTYNWYFRLIDFPARRRVRCMSNRFRGLTIESGRATLARCFVQCQIGWHRRLATPAHYQVVVRRSSTCSGRNCGTKPSVSSAEFWVCCIGWNCCVPARQKKSHGCDARKNL